MSPNGAAVYATGRSRLSVIDTATNAVTDTITLEYGDLYNQLAISPDGCYVYVTNQQLNTITVVSTVTKTVIKTFTYPNQNEPYGVAVSPDGRTVYVANSYVGASGTGTLSVISI